jgi:hypothetical protein
MACWIFLDFDGVLNSDRFYTRAPKLAEKGDLDRKCVALLNELVDKTGAKVVIVSNWRHGHSVSELRDILVDRGFEYPKRVVGKSPDLGEDAVRGYEILAFMKGLRIRDPFVVLDDTDDMDGVEDRFVKTDPKVGLQRADVELAEQILRTPRREAPMR